jgi:mannosyltransferase OCH1-like enzyme
MISLKEVKEILFNKNVEIMYINIDSRKDRNLNIQKELDKINNIKYSRFSAINKNNIDFRKLINDNIITKNTYVDILKNKIVGGHFLTIGALGCFLSHIELWKYSVKNNINLIVFEDDISIRDNFQENIEKLMKSNIDFDMVYFSQSLEKWKQKSIDKDFLWKIENEYWGTYGYIVSPTYAKKLLDNIKNIDIQIDSWLQNINKKLNANIYLFKKYLISTDSQYGRDSDCQSYNKKNIKIPKLIHQIWVGEKPIPESYLIYMESWKKQYPDWSYKLWTDKEVKEFKMYNRELYEKSEKMAQKADILRYEIVYNYGGFYIDSDFESLQKIDELLGNINFVSGFEHNDRNFIANGFFGSVKEHPILKNIIEQMRNNYHNPINKQINQQTGPIYFTRMIEEYIAKNGRDGILIFEACVLYPYYLREKKPLTYENYTYAVHHWGASWL